MTHVHTDEVRAIALRSKAAARAISSLTEEQKNRALAALADALEQNAPAILSANKSDVATAASMLESGEISLSTIDRLRLSDKKLAEMARSIRSVASLPDPVGRVLERTALDDGLVLEKTSCALGVLVVIFEARPDAITQIASLALKSANAVIMKPGREVEASARVLVDTLRCALRQCGIPEDAIQLVLGRAAAQELLSFSDLVDLVIPRGSRQLVEHVQATSRIPVLGHAEGVCHIYIDKAADLDMALRIVDDAKTDYPAACNAAETVLVHEAVAASFLPHLAERLTAKSVKLRGCEKTQAILREHAIEAVEHWHHEYSDLELAIRVIQDVDQAVDHIHRFGSSHTETIVTNDDKTAALFLQQVDSAGVFHNASTRFADGFRYGFGAEVGISTGKLHARGPVGLEGLTTYKYLLRGEGHTAAEFRDAKKFKHRRLPV